MLQKSAHVHEVRTYDGLLALLNAALEVGPKPERADPEGTNWEFDEVRQIICLNYAIKTFLYNSK